MRRIGIKSFKNNLEAWTVHGKYKIFLRYKPAAGIIPRCVNVSGRTLTVLRGSVSDTLENLAFVCEDGPLTLNYDRVICIRNMDSHLLWVNYEYL
jgi:hypothetical protein